MTDDVEGSGSGLILLEELRKIMKNLGRNLNTGLPEYEAAMRGVTRIDKRNTKKILLTVTCSIWEDNIKLNHRESGCGDVD
jgi:hypothetical protein